MICKNYWAILYNYSSLTCSLHSVWSLALMTQLSFSERHKNSKCDTYCVCKVSRPVNEKKKIFNKSIQDINLTPPPSSK